MDDFVIEFFSAVHERKLRAKENNHCNYDDQYLQLFTSSLYLAAFVSSFGASKPCPKVGHLSKLLLLNSFLVDKNFLRIL
jgi:hypothetical protein